MDARTTHCLWQTMFKQCSLFSFVFQDLVSFSVKDGELLLHIYLADLFAFACMKINCLLFIAQKTVIIKYYFAWGICTNMWHFMILKHDAWCFNNTAYVHSLVSRSYTGPENTLKMHCKICNVIAYSKLS